MKIEKTHVTKKFMKIEKGKYELILTIRFMDENQEIITIDIPITMNKL